MSHSTSTDGNELAGQVDVQPAPLVDRGLPELGALLAPALAPSEGVERHP